jgi:lipopolysaccharide export system permease protein
MRILALYVAREFLKHFAFLMVAFVGIYTMFDFIEKVDNFQEAGLSWATMLTFFILQLPEIITLLMPLSVLMGTVITLALMSKRNEIVAIKSSGVSLIRYTLPILLLSLAFTLALALLNETLVPRTKAQTNYIWDALVEKRPGRLVHEEAFWYKGQNSIYKVGFYDAASQTLSDVVYYGFDKDFNLAIRVDARRIRYLSGRWVGFEGLLQERLPGGGYSAKIFEEQPLKLPELPSDFSQLSKPSEEMTFVELARYLDRIEKEGYDARRYRVDLQARISYPFVCFIMALLGIPLALISDRGRAGGSLAPAIIFGLGAALIYWVSFSYARSIFGYSGVLPPYVAVWLSNLVFAMMGLWFMTAIRQ